MHYLSPTMTKQALGAGSREALKWLASGAASAPATYAEYTGWNPLNPGATGEPPPLKDLALPWLANTAAFRYVPGGVMKGKRNPALAAGSVLGALLSTPAIEGMKWLGDKVPGMLEAGRSAVNTDRARLALGAGLGAGALGLGALGLNEARKARKQLESPKEVRDPGLVRITLPTADPDDNETQIELPLNHAKLTQTAVNQLRRDLRRRLRYEGRERTMKHDQPMPDVWAEAKAASANPLAQRIHQLETLSGLWEKRAFMDRLRGWGNQGRAGLSQALSGVGYLGGMLGDLSTRGNPLSWTPSTLASSAVNGMRAHDQHTSDLRELGQMQSQLGRAKSRRSWENLQGSVAGPVNYLAGVAGRAPTAFSTDTTFGDSLSRMHNAGLDRYAAGMSSTQVDPQLQTEVDRRRGVNQPAPPPAAAPAPAPVRPTLGSLYQQGQNLWNNNVLPAAQAYSQAYQAGMRAAPPPAAPTISTTPPTSSPTTPANPTTPPPVKPTTETITPTTSGPGSISMKLKNHAGQPVTLSKTKGGPMTRTTG